MYIAILDDCTNELSDIVKYTKNYFELIHQQVSIDTFLKSNDLLRANIRKYDLLILDILLEENITGIKLAEKIREIDKDIKIVFCSNSKDYSIDAYDVKAYTYILKPIDQYEYYRKLDNLMNELRLNYIKIEDVEHINRNINITQINYIEVVKKKTIVHLTNKQSIIVSKSLKYWETLLSQCYFSIGYKGILINVRNIKEIDRNTALMINNDIIYLSRKYSKSLKIKWYNYLDELL